MLNTIFKRLIGFPSLENASLTTRMPSKDEYQRYTILKDLHIDKSHMIALIYFLRTGSLSKDKIPLAQEAALTLGGFDLLDNYIIDQQQIHEKSSQVSNLPTCPGDDTNNDYSWTLVYLGTYPSQEEKRIEYCDKGWSASGKTIQVSGDQHEKETFMYYRKPLNDVGEHY